MRPNNLDVPYGTHKGKAVLWQFSLPYAPLDEFMLPAQKQLAMSRLPRAEREDLLQVDTAASSKMSASNALALSAASCSDICTSVPIEKTSMTMGLFGCYCCQDT